MSQSQYQGIPQAMMPVVRSSGIVSDVWYRFFQTIWSQISSGTNTNVTLQGVAEQAATAQTTADNALTAVENETTRAQAAEAALQTQITSNTNNITTLQGQVAALQNTVANLQTQIDTINTRLANAGIP